MKNCIKILSVLCLLAMLLSIFAACGEDKEPEKTGKEDISEKLNPNEAKLDVDYVSQLKLDMNSSSKKLEVTVKSYIDGDTTHFFVPESEIPTGILKARYLAVNTPESTGLIEKWGKQASNFTHDKLKTASSIIIESDDENWNADSTGGRYLVWVWYKPEGQNEYRNLNLELLQYGYAVASNSGKNRYGETCTAAIAQARAAAIHVYAGADVKDPLFYEGAVRLVTLKALRTDPETYNSTSVSFEGEITRESNNTVYVQDYDSEDGIYYGMNIFLGYGADADLLDMMRIGNRVKIVGKLQYYEEGGTWQVAGVQYNPRNKDESSMLIEERDASTVVYTPTDAKQFASGKLSVTVMKGEAGEDQLEVTEDRSYSELVMSTAVSMTGLTVNSVYTTNNEASSSNGAMTLTCAAPDGTIISVRTTVLKDASGNLITASAYQNKTIDVKGIVDYFSGSYQIKVFSYKDITVKD